MEADRSFCTSSGLSNPQLEFILDFLVSFIDLQDMMKGLLMLSLPRNTKCFPHPFPSLPFFLPLLSFFSLVSYPLPFTYHPSSSYCLPSFGPSLSLAFSLCLLSYFSSLFIYLFPASLSTPCLSPI